MNIPGVIYSSQQYKQKTTLLSMCSDVCPTQSYSPNLLFQDKCNDKCKDKMTFVDYYSDYTVLHLEHNVFLLFPAW